MINLRNLKFWRRKKKEKKPFTWRSWLKDWGISIIVAAAIYFLILPAVLGTMSPMVVVSSCSERGYLNIGDLLVLQGTGPANIRAPEIEISDLHFIPIVQNEEVVGLNFSGAVVMLNRSNDIIVYSAYPSRYQIIHRVFAKLKINGEYYLITKGDANAVPDQIWFAGDSYGICADEAVGNCISALVRKEMIVGKALFSVPFLGHVKLFFCDIMPFCDGHSNPGTGYKYMLSC